MSLIRRDVIPADCPAQSLHVLRGLMERPEVRWFYVEESDRGGVFFYRLRSDWPEWAPPLPAPPKEVARYWPSYLALREGRVVMYSYDPPADSIEVPEGWRAFAVPVARLDDFITWVERVWSVEPDATIAVIVEYDTPEVPMPDCDLDDDDPDDDDLDGDDPDDDDLDGDDPDDDDLDGDDPDDCPF